MIVMAKKRCHMSAVIVHECNCNKAISQNPSHLRGAHGMYFSFEGAVTLFADLGNSLKLHTFGFKDIFCLPLSYRTDKVLS